MGFSINYKELSSYLSSITVMKDDFNSFLKNLLLEMAEKVIVKTKRRTPVDTGSLINAWQLGDIQGEGENISVEILNGMEYATDVEYGHRGVYVPSLGVTMWTDRKWTEGRFMLKISVDEIRKQIPLKYQNEFKKFCIQHRIEI